MGVTFRLCGSIFKVYCIESLFILFIYSFSNFLFIYFVFFFFLSVFSFLLFLKLSKNITRLKLLRNIGTVCRYLYDYIRNVRTLNPAGNHSTKIYGLIFSFKQLSSDNAIVTHRCCLGDNSVTCDSDFESHSFG